MGGIFLNGVVRVLVLPPGGPDSTQAVSPIEEPTLPKRILRRRVRVPTKGRLVRYLLWLSEL